MRSQMLRRDLIKADPSSSAQTSTREVLLPHVQTPRHGPPHPPKTRWHRQITEGSQVRECSHTPERRHLRTEMELCSGAQQRSCLSHSQLLPASHAEEDASVHCCSSPELHQPQGKARHKMVVCLCVAEERKALPWGVFKNKP